MWLHQRARSREATAHEVRVSTWLGEGRMCNGRNVDSVAVGGHFLVKHASGTTI